ncbi:hypothetical protein GCM10010406_00140 [Streptomyces thermolineatus]|uniref:FHA domain-containing protein n=1 Tax=Streptomyces thermolineatus TaxID=44033 RepID=A0ABN3KSR8_9ACTN
MQIRLTVLGPRSGQTCDVLVTAPSGTELGAVAGGIAAAAGSGQPVRSPGSAVPLYSDGKRLDPAAPLGRPPLVDGAVVSLHAPSDAPAAAPAAFTATGPRLHVTGGPDAGGVHLLRGGPVRVGRSADADVPLDDPDVSRLHCAVTVDDSRVTVADLGSTNGTTVDGRAVGNRPVALEPGALLRIGETTLQLELPADDGALPAAPPAVPAVPDGEGHLCVTPVTAAPAAPVTPAAPAGDAAGDAAGSGATAAPGAPGGTTAPGGAPHHDTATDGTPRHGTAHHGTVPDDTVPDDTPPGHTSPAVAEETHSIRVPAREDARTGPVQDSASPWGWSAVSDGLKDLARRVTAGLVTGRAERDAAAQAAADARRARERWPDPATLLLTALGPGPRLWERRPGHDDALTVRLGTADLPSPAGDGTLLPSAPVVVDLRSSRSLGLVGPRPRLAGLARSVVAQLCALHAPGVLEVVVVSADRERPAEQRLREWAWAAWLPHLRPAHGQECRLLTAHDREQADARLAELARRVEEGPLGSGWAGASSASVAEAAAAHTGPFTVLVVDGDPGSAAAGELLARLAAAGPSVGVHLLALAEDRRRLPAGCGALATLDTDVATTLHLDRGAVAAPLDGVTADAVSAAWAERFARALAPLREADGAPPAPTALPSSARLLDELDLALATPAKVAARWDGRPPGGPAARVVLGPGADGQVAVDLALEGSHLLVGGAPGSGKTELLRAVAASLALAERPDRLSLVLLEGAAGRGEGLAPCTDLPHVSAHVTASDPLRMREVAQALTTGLKRREEALAGAGPAGPHGEATLSGHLVAQRRPPEEAAGAVPFLPRQGSGGRAAAPAVPADRPGTAAGGWTAAAGALPRLVVLVDDLDALVDPPLGSPGRPSAGSVLRALEAVARDGARLGVHLVASTGRPERTAGTGADERSRLRIALRTDDAESSLLLVGTEDAASLDEAVPGRGLLLRPGGPVTAFQTGRISGRIPRTATVRPTVVPLDPERAGDPPARRRLRELGNGPTDLALLASALQRAAESAGAVPVPAPSP